ncbi:VUT family protein [Endozoicomonas sp. SCSIO W0465]|uniref:VUT family protein n=1 Tax=Endozoicomonas sp. SCSIO W0465 TaxID=2918516 RepID=UPI002075C339|nr:VUT family protein [Endozoicomonas sp. SCSIO W0465]USE35727.1 VUT family protein [Endozoicomonas sp. SCSIO W0465]
MLRFHSYDAIDDTATTTNSFGKKRTRHIKPFIRSGQANDLPREDRAELFGYLEGRSDIIADQGLNGCHCFSLPGDRPLLNYLWGLYMVTMAFCPVLFNYQFGWWWVDFTLGSMLFPLGFAFLNPVSELYGQRSARRLLNYTVLVLLSLALLSGVLNLLLGLMDNVLEDFPIYYAPLAAALWITDTINIQLFQKFRCWMNQQWFPVRALLSNWVSLVVFTPMCAFFLYGAFWENSELNSQVWGIARLKVLLSLLYLTLPVAIVHCANQWRRDNIK